MTKIREILKENRDAVIKWWIDDTLETYAPDASAAFKKQKDPFANPVGNSLRKGTRGIIEALIDGPDAERIRENLYEIIKIRAIQEFSPSKAVGFVFRLKEAVRAQLKKMGGTEKFSSELAEFDGQVDRIALAAFDIFVQCREQVSELRINEVKRRVSWIMEKFNEGTPDPDAVPDESEVKNVQGH